MSVLILACEVMREELLRVPAVKPVEFSFLSMGLHVAPDRLRAALAAELAKPRAVDRIVLGFGLCGNAVDGLSSPHAPLVIPRAHDCIAVLSGGVGLPETGPSLERGTFYLSGGWMEGERTIMSEHRRTVQRFGERKALRVLNTLLGAYQRFLFIQTDHPRSEARQQEATQLASLVGLPLDSVAGDGAYLAELVNGPWSEERFIHVPRGETLSARAFGAPSLAKSPESVITDTSSTPVPGR
jgi:hypothetical protein